jgi:electron transfer flavoprotein beta subunit
VLDLEHAADLVLAGRELGDHDTGTVVPCLAEQLGWRFAGLIQSIEWAHSGLRLMRERGNLEEWMTLPFPLVASITNDRRNRLRHPLFKNVVAAKRASFALVPAPGLAEAACVALTGVRLADSQRRTSSCRVLEGSIAAQTAELAEFLEQRHRRA